MKHPVNYHFEGNNQRQSRWFCPHLAILLVAFAAGLSLSVCTFAQSSDQQSSSQGQASQKPDQTPPEAGGPGGEVGPMAVPKKTDSSDDTPPPPRPKKQADIPEY